MRQIALVLCIALVMSLSYVPPVQAAPANDGGPSVITSVAIVAVLVLGLSYLAKAGGKILADEREATLKEYANANPDVDPRVLEAMRNEQVMLGMNAEQVRLAVGNPTTINRTVTESTVREQWVYSSSLFNTKYVYLENGVVTSWQD